MDAPLALAFTAGMVATVNPCGFAMLPAYLSYFLGLEATEDGSSEPATAGSVGRCWWREQCRPVSWGCSPWPGPWSRGRHSG